MLGTGAVPLQLQDSRGEPLMEQERASENVCVDSCTVDVADTTVYVSCSGSNSKGTLISTDAKRGATACIKRKTTKKQQTKDNIVNNGTVRGWITSKVDNGGRQ